MKTAAIFISVGAAVSLALATVSTPVKADPVQRGLQGAIGGAIIGGVLGGGKGIGRGAAIGGAIGVIGGALEEDRRAPYRYRRRHYREYRYIEYNHSPLVRNIQASLIRLGYNPGPVDGVMGGQTAHAIGVYEDEHGLKITHRPSKALWRHMKRNGG